LLLDATQALNCILDRIDPFLKDDLLRGMLELLASQPSPMRQRPMAASAVNPAVPQQEGERLLTFAAKIVARRLAGADEIAHRLMSHVGRPHSRQFTGAIQPRQRDPIPPVRLDPLARPFRNQSWGDHHAVVTKRLDLAIKPVSRRPGLKADMQPVISVGQPLDRPLDRQRVVLHLAQKPDLSAPASFSDRDRVLLLGDIESHEDFAILFHGPPSVHEARLGMPEQPSFLPARKGGPPARAREHDV
jgi:hypothetical protein